MSITEGYPRATTIIVPDAIPLGDAGLYVSFAVGEFLDSLGTAHVLRRSVALRFLEPRIAVLQFESTQALLISGEQRKRFEDAKTALNNTPTPVREAKEAVLQPDPLLTAASNRKK